MKITFEQAFAGGPETLNAWLQTKRNHLTQEQANMLGEFINGLESTKEIFSYWNSLQRSGINLALVHPIVEKTLVRVATTRQPGEPVEDVRVERQYVHTATGHILDMKIAEDAIPKFDARFAQGGYAVVNKAK